MVAVSIDSAHAQLSVINPIYNLTNTGLNIHSDMLCEMKKADARP
jgi:hypothetical protein